MNFYQFGISTMTDEQWKAVQLVMRLSPNVNRLLTESARRTGRSKIQEALLRLTDHLNNFEDIATEGKRFSRTD